MLSEITLSNFKCFKKDIAFPLANINLLTGVNGRGKSSVLQSLLLMKQSVDIDNYTESVYLNGNCVDLGTVEAIKNIETSRELPIVIKFKRNVSEFEGMYLEIAYAFSTQDVIKVDGKIVPVNLIDRYLTLENIKIESNLPFSVDNSPIGLIFPVQSTKIETNEIIVDIANKKIVFQNKERTLNSLVKFMPEVSLTKENELIYSRVFQDIIDFQKIHYIAADRIGPQNFYHYTDISNLSKFISVDKQGKYAPFVLFASKDESVYDNLCLGQDAKTVEQQTEEWLNAILDNAKVKLRAENETINIYYNSNFKPSNVGFGYSYILPIIISGLIAKKGEILIVENPEAHLHPKAQSKLTKFLAKIAENGVQIFIESHSEHILNALRIVAVNKDYMIKNTDISVLYFQDDAQKPVLPIPINNNGGIEHWPQSFFDQEENDLSEIFRLTRK